MCAPPTGYGFSDYIDYETVADAVWAAGGVPGLPVMPRLDGDTADTLPSEMHYGDTLQFIPGLAHDYKSLHDCTRGVHLQWDPRDYDVAEPWTDGSAVAVGGAGSGGAGGSAAYALYAGLYSETDF